MRHDDPELEVIQEEMFGTRSDGSSQGPDRELLMMALAVPTALALWLGIAVGTGRALMRRKGC